MKNLYILILFFAFFLTALPQTENEPIDSTLFRKAEQLCKDLLLVDTHMDLPDWLYDEWFDVSKESKSGEIDYPRARKGGLDIAFMSIYIGKQLFSWVPESLRVVAAICKLLGIAVLGGLVLGRQGTYWTGQCRPMASVCITRFRSTKEQKTSPHMALEGSPRINFPWEPMGTSLVESYHFNITS